LGVALLEALNPVEVDVAIGNVAGAKEDWTFASEFVILGPISVANLEQAIIDELLECGLSEFTCHISPRAGLFQWPLAAFWIH
jgi:hypothetical protein